MQIYCTRYIYETSHAICFIGVHPALNFFLWSFLENIAYKDTLRSIRELKKKIEDTFRIIDTTMSWKLFINLSRRASSCLAHEGDCLKFFSNIMLSLHCLIISIFFLVPSEVTFETLCSSGIQILQILLDHNFNFLSSWIFGVTKSGPRLRPIDKGDIRKPYYDRYVTNGKMV